MNITATRVLQSHAPPDVEIARVSVGDYLSMNGDLRFDELQQGLERAPPPVSG